MQVVYDAGNMLLSPIWEAFRGPVNDVVVCRDLKSPVGARYTLLVVRDRACVKQMLTVFDQSERVSSEGRPPYLLRFAQGDELCFVFEYREERKLSAFAAGQMTTPILRETVAVNLVMECLSSPLPYPLLQLVLTQDCVQIEKDNSVYFTPLVDLSELDPSATEAECAACCAQLLLEHLAEVVILDEGVTEVSFLREPAGIPILDYANTDTVRINFLAHNLPPSAYSFSLSTRVMCEVLLSIRNARPCALGRIRLRMGPGPT